MALIEYELKAMKIQNTGYVRLPPVRQYNNQVSRNNMMQNSNQYIPVNRYANQNVNINPNLKVKPNVSPVDTRMFTNCKFGDACNRKGCIFKHNR